MPLPLLAAAGISLLPSAFKTISGLFQKNKADDMNPVNPGYTMNNQVIDNARVLGERYRNYTMPGYSVAQQNINQSGTNAFTQGIQGASSGGDVLDLATKIAYGQNDANNQLAVQNAQGKEGALMQSLQADAMAGNEYQQKNAYDRDIYQQQLREKAGLTQAGNQNVYNGLDSASSVASSFLMPRASIDTTGGSVNNGTSQKSIFSETSVTPQQGFSPNTFNPSGFTPQITSPSAFNDSLTQSANAGLPTTVKPATNIFAPQEAPYAGGFLNGYDFNQFLTKPRTRYGY